MASRIILITGANSGVGYATTEVLAKASSSFHIIMTGRSLAKVEQAKSEIESAGDLKGTLAAVQLDVTDSASVKTAAQQISDKHGRLDALINNAAVGVTGIDDLAQRLRTTFETNVIGAAVVAETFRPLLLKSSNPYHVWVSSGVGSLKEASSSKNSLPNEESYRSSKAAMNMLAVLENRDYGPKGLKVFALSPGFVISNLRGSDEQARKGWGNAQPASTSGEFILDVLNGKRDSDVGLLIGSNTVFPW